MARPKSVTKTDMDRAISTAVACGLVVTKIVLKPQSVELIIGSVDQKAKPDNDGVNPREW